jgi:hypothetical protein
MSDIAYRQPHGSEGTIRPMDAVHDAREAKKFLISKIVAEAQSEKAQLSETERKMLYFTRADGRFQILCR